MGNAPRVAIVGASARAAALSALRAGFDVVTADLFADADLRDACPATRIASDNYPHGLADWLAAQDVDAWMYTGGLENHPDLVDRMAELKPLWGNRGAALRRVRDPLELQRVCHEQEVLFPETRVNPAGLPLDGSWLCKTYRGAGGSGVWALDGQVALKRAAAAGAVFQRRQPGKTASLLYLINSEGAQRIGGTEQLIGLPELNAPEFAFCGCLRSEGLLAGCEEASEAIGAAAAGVGLRGLVGADVLLTDDGLCLLEINPRYPASEEIIAYASPVWQPVLGLHAGVFGRVSASFPPPAVAFSGKGILFAKRGVAVGEGFFRWARESPEAGCLADIPAAGTKINAGEPVLTILDTESPDGVLDRLKSSAAEVESRLFLL